MNKPSYVYVTYISTTPEKVWRALVDTDLARQYWTDPAADHPAHVNVSDWKPGSRWEHQRADDTHTVDVTGKVIESDPPRRLVLSWARPKDADDDSKHSRVTFDVEPQGARLVRLTVTHEDLEHDLPMLAGVSTGWPKILSNLKTWLETGHSLQRDGVAHA